MRMSDALLDTSIAGLVNLLHEGTGSASADFAFNINGDAPPLFVIHAYLGGMLGFRRLAELLPPNQPVYGLHVHCTTEQCSDELTISGLAQDALNRIRAIQPAGRITMLGHSAGGLIAFEVARKIFEAGDLQPRVLLMDSVVVRNTLEYQWGELLLTWREKVNKSIRAPQKIVGRLLRMVWPRHSQSCHSAQNDGWMELAGRYLEPTGRAVRRYKVRTYGGDVTVMRTHQGQVMALGRRDLGWPSVIKGALSMIDVPGAHLSMLEKPHIEHVAEKVTGWLSGK
jgi:thioesterase domain-containing protein